jgi:hypothetical protein
MPDRNSGRNSAAHKRSAPNQARSSAEDLERRLREGQRAGNTETPPQDAARGGAKRDRQRS